MSKYIPDEMISALGPTVMGGVATSTNGDHEQAFADACKAVRRKYAQAWVDGIGNTLKDEAMFTTGFLRKHVGILYDALGEAQRALAALSVAGMRGENECLQDMIDVRGYAANRAKVALDAINAARKSEFVNHDDES